MAEEVKQWEYRVETFGSSFGTKDEHIQATLNEWGIEGGKPSMFIHPMEAARLRSSLNVC